MATQIKQSYEPMWKEKRTFPARFPNGMPVGKRTLKRAEQNRELNKLPDSVKKHCELQISPNCTRTRLLTWAHSLKSRFILTDKDWQEAARACLPCHDVADSMKHSEMKALVLLAISKRKKKQILPNG